MMGYHRVLDSSLVLEFLKSCKFLEKSWNMICWFCGTLWLVGPLGLRKPGAPRELSPVYNALRMFIYPPHPKKS